MATASMEVQDLIQHIVDVHTTLYSNISDTVENNMEQFASHLFTRDIIGKAVRDSMSYSKCTDGFWAGLKWKKSQEKIESHCQNFLDSLTDIGANGKEAAVNLKKAWQDEAKEKLGITLFSGPSEHQAENLSRAWQDEAKTKLGISGPSGLHNSRSSLQICFCCTAITFFLIIIVLLLSVGQLYHNALQHQDSPPHPTDSQSSASPTSSVNVPIDTVVVSSIKQFEHDFLYLLSDIQVSLNSNLAEDKVMLEHLGRYLCNVFNVRYEPISYQDGKDQIDTWFQKIRQFFNFMDTSLLKNIGRKFLNGKFTSKIEDYDKSLEQFIGSTPITQLSETVRTSHTELREEETKIVLKLGRNWNDKNHKNLNHLVHYIFGDDASLMRLISIHRSVLTVVYALPNTLFTSALKKVEENTKLSKMAGVVSVQVNETVTSVNEDESSNEDNDTKQYDTSLALFDVLQNLSNVSDIKFLVAIGADVNCYSKSGFTPLIYAVSLGNLAGITALLELHASPDLRDSNGITALMVAGLRNDLRIAEELLHFNADPDIQGVNGVTVLILASTKGFDHFVDLLLRHNADPNKQTSAGFTALYLASRYGFLSCVNILLKYNALPNIQDANGSTPLHLASANGHSQIVSLLLTHSANPNLKNSFDVIPLHIAAANGHETCVRMLLNAISSVNARNNQGFTSLFLASYRNHSTIVRLLLAFKADPSLRYLEGYTSLHVSALLGFSNCVLAHLESGVDPNSQTDDGFAALHIASQRGHTSVIEALLNSKASVDIQGNDDYAELCVSQLKLPQKQRGRPITHPLLKVHSPSGITPLMAAVSTGRAEVVKLLLEHGSDPNMCNGKFNALNMAAYYGPLEVVKLLLEHNVHFDMHEAVSPLLAAISEGHVDIVKALLNAGADVNRRDKFYNSTALMVAASQGNTRMVQLLLNAGADVTVRNKHGDTVHNLVKALLRDSFGFDSQSLKRSGRYLTILKLLSKDQDSYPDSMQTSTNITFNSSVYELVHEVKYKLKEINKSSDQDILSSVQLSFGYVHSEFRSIFSKLLRSFKDLSEPISLSNIALGQSI